MGLKNWKFLLGFAIFGFFIAFISGIIGGIGFGRLLLRGALSAVLLGGAISILMMIIKNKLPDLYALIFSGSLEYEDTVEERGGVDIIISDDEEVQEAKSDNFVEEITEISGFQGEDKDTVEELSAAEDDESSTDELPELKNLENTFEQKDFGNTAGLSDISKDSKTIELLGEYQNPEEVARAVQTMMKKDEG